MKQPVDTFGTRLFFISILVLVGFPLLINFQYTQLNHPEISNSHNEFSSKRAFQHLSELLDGIDSHPVDSPKNHKVADRIISKLKQMDFPVQVKLNPSCVDSINGTAHCALVKNIVVYIEGSQPEGTILLSAHYDSVAAAPGASDAGTAVASLLTIAELLTKQPKSKNSLVLLFNDGEEYGLLGARAFLLDSQFASLITDVINIDAIGSNGPSLLIETANTTQRLLQTYSVASPAPVASSFISDIWSRIPSDTDMTIYKRHDLAGYNFINLETDPHYHTPQDNLANVSLSSLQQHGDNAWSLLKILLDKEHQLEAEKSTLVFTDFLATSIIVLSLDQVYLASVLCVLLLFISAWRLYNQQLISLKSAVVSHLLVLALIGLGGISAVVIKKLCQIVLGTDEPWNQSFALMQLLLLFSISTVIFLESTFGVTTIQELISSSHFQVYTRVVYY